MIDLAQQLSLSQSSNYLMVFYFNSSIIFLYSRYFSTNSTFIEFSSLEGKANSIVLTRYNISTTVPSVKTYEIKNGSLEIHDISSLIPSESFTIKIYKINNII